MTFSGSVGPCPRISGTPKSARAEVVKYQGIRGILEPLVTASRSGAAFGKNTRPYWGNGAVFAGSPLAVGKTLGNIRGMERFRRFAAHIRKNIRPYRGNGAVFAGSPLAVGKTLGRPYWGNGAVFAGLQLALDRTGGMERNGFYG